MTVTSGATSDAGSDSGSRPFVTAVGREAGDIIASWLLRLVVFLLVGSLLVFEAGAVLVNAMTTTDAAQQIAHAAATAYREGRTADAARSTAEEVSVDRGVDLVDVTVDRDALSVTVRDRARTLVIHEIPALERYLVREATGTVPLG